MPSEMAVTTLENLRTAIDDDAFGECDRLLGDLADTYESLRGEEAALEREAMAVRDRVDPLNGGIPEELTEFVTSSSATSMGRGGVLWGTQQYLLDPTEGGSDDLKQQIDDLVEQEEAFIETESSLRTTLRSVDVELPAILVASSAQLPDGPYVTGQAYDLTAATGNVGDELAESVSLRLDAPDEVSVSSNNTDIGTLDSGAEATRTFAVKADTPGEYNVAAVIESSEGDIASDSNSAQFVVLGPDGLSEQALKANQRAKKRLEDSSLKKGGEQSLLAKLELAEQKIKQGRSHLENKNETLADNHFEAATRMLGGFLNGLESNGKPSRSLDDTTRIALENLVSSAIDQLALAQKA